VRVQAVREVAEEGAVGFAGGGDDFGAADDGFAVGDVLGDGA